MLTTKLISYYNHLLATTVLYFTIVDPLQELANQLILRDTLDSGPVPCFVLADIQNDDKDYYQVLGVSKDATKHEIHKAFRQLAKKYHPDKNKDKDAQDEFIRIFKAYETLSDEKKRSDYDQQSKASSHQHSFNNWHTNEMPNFDMNDFFKQYEDQMLRHTQYHNQQHQQHTGNHHAAHEQAFFHGINLDDLFHDIDEDEFISMDGGIFGSAGHSDPLHGSHHHQQASHDSLTDGIFGDGASFFKSYIPSQFHDTLHQFQHNQNLHNSGSNRRSYSCQTITKHVNGIVMTQTSCG